MAFPYVEPVDWTSLLVQLMTCEQIDEQIGEQIGECQTCAIKYNKKFC
jgi:hypothetical protein